MTDKEKIELIIQDKHLNNSEFCNEVCISPGTLSHIRSGRTEPTLNILRSIVQAFPDINPAWVFYGEEPMYKKDASPTPSTATADDAYLNNVDAERLAGDVQPDLFAFAGNMSQSSRSNAVSVSPVSSPSPQGPASARRGAASVAPASVLNVQEIVAETLKQHQKPQRRVVEVRIFFDDGTFETFGAK